MNKFLLGLGFICLAYVIIILGAIAMTPFEFHNATAGFLHLLLVGLVGFLCLVSDTI